MSPDFPRVLLPGTTLGEVAPFRDLLDAASAQERHIAKERHGMVEAMVRLGKRPARPGRKRPSKPTAHVRNMRARAARAYVLKERAS